MPFQRVWSPGTDQRTGHSHHKQTVAAGVTSDPLLVGSGPPVLGIAAHPGAGGSAKVEFTLSLYNDIEAGGGKWLEWAAGVVVGPFADVLEGPITALRFTAATQPADFEVMRPT